jgi:hypothetical protein
MEYAKSIRKLATQFRVRALTVRDDFLCQELYELAEFCEAKAARIDEHAKPPKARDLAR